MLPSRLSHLPGACLPGAVLFTMLLAPASAQEVPPDAERPCFPGAGYRKAVSSTDLWNGIEAVVTLPTPSYDPERARPGTGKPLDNASIYLGGHADEQEVDAGVNWEVVREPNGSVSPVGKAFRPFWRANSWNSGPARPDLYFFPGDTIRMSVRATTEPDTLRIDIALLHRGTEPTTGVESGKTVWKGVERVAAAAAQDAEWNEARIRTAEADPVTSFSATFEAPGFGIGRLQEFKRVNGLDQSGNEGRPVQPTRTRITGAVWREVNLFRGTGEKEQRIPLTPKRFTDMRCPDPGTVVVTPIGTSGERVDLLGITASR